MQCELLTYPLNLITACALSKAKATINTYGLSALCRGPSHIFWAISGEEAEQVREAVCGDCEHNFPINKNKVCAKPLSQVLCQSSFGPIDRPTFTKRQWHRVITDDVTLILTLMQAHGNNSFMIVIVNLCNALGLLYVELSYDVQVEQPCRG